MDISVSRLNGRLATKLPPELPLGLVFVVGVVSRVDDKRFVLTEGIHQLHCQLVEHVQLRAEDEVRASGHLMFDAERLQYYLLARDVEVITTDPLGSLAGDSRELLAESEDLLSALAAVKARASVAPAETSEEMPVWVKKLAPPEVQVIESGEDGLVGGEQSASQSSRAVALEAGLVSMLSAAMDSEEELELTPDLLEPYMITEPVVVATADETERGAMDTAVPTQPTSYKPTNREDTDWLVILLIISFVVLTIAIIVTIILLILQ
jgi:hypothetical protein